MFDLRETKTIDLRDANCLKDDTTYHFVEKLSGKNLIAKFIAYYNDEYDEYLLTEFRKLALLSGEPEIATVYFLVKGQLPEKTQSCYIMDFVDGQTLQEFLENRDSIVYDVILDLLIQISSGLEKAHNYEISHGDLHNGNIMINKYGSAKIIDFLWWDYKVSFDENLNVDIQDFKRITNELNAKCKVEDVNRLSIIINYCTVITNFKGLSKELQILNDISFDLSFMGPSAKFMLSKLFELATQNDLNKVLKYYEDNIPVRLIPNLTEKENEYIEKIKKGTNIKYLDTRIETLRSNLMSVVDSKLSKFKQIGLIDWNMVVQNEGDVFIGPYSFCVMIIFNSKFFNWKRINDLLPFVESSNFELDLLTEEE